MRTIKDARLQGLTMTDNSLIETIRVLKRIKNITIGEICACPVPSRKGIASISSRDECPCPVVHSPASQSTSTDCMLYTRL